MKEEKDLQLIKASEKDAKELTELLTRVYYYELNKWNKTKEEGYLPGYDSEEMQKFYMKAGNYFKLLYDGKIAGMVLVTYNGGYHARLDRLYIDSEYQGKHIGTKAMELIDGAFPKVKVWTLDTYKNPPRNAHFYEKLGYEKQWEDEFEIGYKKVVQGTQVEVNHKDENLSKKEYMDCNMRECDFYEVSLSKSKFVSVGMSQVKIESASLNKSTITNANMTGTLFGDIRMDHIEICHASLGGAYIHDTNLGWFDENEPIKFQRCDFKKSKFEDCDFTGVEIAGGNISDMKINGVAVKDMIEVYNTYKK